MAVLPVDGGRPGDKDSGKRPITPNGVKNATKNFDEFLAFVGDRPDFNIGIATGATNGLIVLDIDPRNGGDETMKANIAAYGDLPDGPSVHTGGGGRHLYFSTANMPSFNGTKLGDGVDVKADNGYVVGPGSLHWSGNRYEWADGRASKNVSFPELPDAWKAAINGKIKKPSADTVASAK